MKVMNIMLSRGLGGIEQVFLDYTDMLRAEGVEVIPVMHPQSEIRNRVADPVYLANYGKWDIGAMYRLRQCLKLYKPDRIITHGNRALSLVRYLCDRKSLYPVAHNYWISHFHHLPNAIAITQDIAEKLKQQGVKNFQVIPNIVRAETAPKPPSNHYPPVIGTMGRMVHKKGFDHFLRALSVLKANHVPFKAVIGGSGEEEQALKKLSAELKLDDVLTFLGWITNKEEFFNSLDVFCLPSRSEPFGIVLLEALARGIPVVSTKNEGATQITTNGVDAMLCDAENLAKTIQELLSNPNVMESLRHNGFQTAQKYSPNIVGKKLKNILSQ